MVVHAWREGNVLCNLQFLLMVEHKLSPFRFSVAKAQEFQHVKSQYDGQVVVKFQENAWCDEEMIKF